MILPQSYQAVLFLMVLSLLCLGSWASAFKFAGNWRFELFYLDFAIGLFLASVIFAFTLGDIGYDGFNFLDDLQHAGRHQWMWAFLAGLLFNFGNMLLLAAVSVSGLAVAFPMGMAKHEVRARAGQAKSTRRPSPVKGIILALLAGLFLGCFTPMVEKARYGDQGLGPYAVGFIFAFGAFFSSFVFDIFFMNLPVEGEPLEFGGYLRGHMRQHLAGLGSGFVWYTGLLLAWVCTSVPAAIQGELILRFMMAQGSPILAALWGIVVFREFKNSDVRVKLLGTLMLVLFLCGVAMIGLAPQFLSKS